MRAGHPRPGRAMRAGVKCQTAPFERSAPPTTETARTRARCRRRTRRSLRHAVPFIARRRRHGASRPVRSGTAQRRTVLGAEPARRRRPNPRLCPARGRRGACEPHFGTFWVATNGSVGRSPELLTAGASPVTRRAVRITRVMRAAAPSDSGGRAQRQRRHLPHSLRAVPAPQRRTPGTPPLPRAQRAARRRGHSRVLGRCASRRRPFASLPPAARSPPRLCSPAPSMRRSPRLARAARNRGRLARGACRIATRGPRLAPRGAAPGRFPRKGARLVFAAPAPSKRSARSELLHHRVRVAALSALCPRRGFGATCGDLGGAPTCAAALLCSAHVLAPLAATRGWERDWYVTWLVAAFSAPPATMAPSTSAP
jgi:hypothetical protein